MPPSRRGRSRRACCEHHGALADLALATAAAPIPTRSPDDRAMKTLAAALLLVLVLLQCRIWLANDGVRGVERLERAVATQRAQNARLTERNSRLAAEVEDLKTGTAAIEERARTQLGMIGPNETFYQVVEPAPARAASQTNPGRTAHHHAALGPSAVNPMHCAVRAPSTPGVSLQGHPFAACGEPLEARAPASCRRASGPGPSCAAP
jgi:cell division protein FtsB